MKRSFLACCFFVFALSCFAQGGFPQSFVGHWEGELFWYQTGKKAPQKVKMQLIVRPAGSLNTFTWQIIYGENNQDNRPYILQPVDTAQGHWQVDEGNGIVLDQYFVGNRLTGSFTVQASTLVNSYWQEGEKLVAEFYSLTASPVNTTGKGTAESPAVAGYGVKSYQRAVLEKKR